MQWSSMGTGNSSDVLLNKKRYRWILNWKKYKNCSGLCSIPRYDTYNVLKRNTKIFCLIIWVDKADTKKWLPNEGKKHRRFCPKTTKFYTFAIIMVVRQ